MIRGAVGTGTVGETVMNLPIDANAAELSHIGKMAGRASTTGTEDGSDARELICSWFRDSM
jgi:hypothetical protein